ncbi:MAG: zincin-like metallopeptidase domain-containing protein [Rhodospirillaceae bacterium]
MEHLPRAARLLRYEQITSGIVADIETGRVIKYLSPWLGGGPPSNAKSKRIYEGLINDLILWCAQMNRGYRHTEWITAKQAASWGGRPRKGEKPTTILFGRPRTGGQRGYGGLVQVFNVEQCVGLPSGPQLPDPSWQWRFPPLERLVSRMKIDFRVGGTAAIYHPKEDYIQVPDPGLYYHPGRDWPRTVVHEVCHSTKHPSRLNREKLDREPHVASAREELLAELATAYVLANMRHYAPTASPSYIADWLHFAKVESDYLFEIAAAATDIAEYILEFDR